jgi:hypothetical protein
MQLPAAFHHTASDLAKDDDCDQRRRAPQRKSRD